jgi:hypothetical protein
MDLLDQIPEERVTELSKEGVRRLRKKMAKDDLVTLMQIACEKANSQAKQAMNELKTGVMTPERMEENKQKLAKYLAICVSPHKLVYGEEKGTEKDIRLIGTFGDRYERRTSLEAEIKDVLKQPSDIVES